MTNLIDVKYSKQELDNYANSSDTCVTLVRKKRDVLLYPVQLSDLRAGVRQNMDALLLKYDYLFNSIILGYNRIKILSKCGLISHANARIKVQIEADFYLFNPAVGSKLKGVVCKRSGHHLGCLVHKAFNAYIPTKDDNHKSELYYFIGQDLTFTVVDLDLTSGRLPYLRGQLDDGNTERSDGDSIVNQVGPDSGTSFSHEEDAGGWDSGIASSPGKYTLANEDIESEDKYNYGMKRGVGESMVTSKTVQLVAGNTTNKLKNSPKTDAGVENLSSIAKVLDKYYSSQDYGVSDDESQQSVQETIKESESFSTDNSPVAKGKSKSRIKKNGSTLKNKEKLKLTSWDPENSITEESKTSSSPVNSDEKIRNTAQEIIEMIDVTSKVTTTPSKKKTKSNSKKNCSSSSPDDLIKQLLKSMESSFVEEEIDSSEKKDLENTAILPSPVKVAEEMEEICKEGESKLRIQQTKGENEVSLKSPSSTTKRRKSPSKVENISTPEKKYLGSGGSQTLLNDSVAAEDSKSKRESQKNLEESGSPSVDGVVAVKKKRKSKNNNDESPLKTVSLGDAKTSIREGPNIPILIQSDEKTPQKSTDMALTISNVNSSSAKKKGKSVSKKNCSSSSPDDLIKQLLKSMESSFVDEEIDSSEKKDLGNAAITSPPVKVVVDSEGIGKEDKSKIRSLEVSEDSGISVKKPSSATKKRKSMSKVKKEVSPGKVGVINDVSEKKDMENTVITPPVKVVVDSEGMGNEDKSKIISLEVSEDSRISVKKPSSTTKKRKSMSKVKKEGSPDKDDLITKLLKNVERSIFETDITQDKSLENEKEETTVGVNANVTERNKQARKSTGSLKEKKISMEETSSNSEKKAHNLIDNYLEQIKTHILSKHEALYDLKSTVELSTKGKNKGRHSTSNISPVSSNTRDEKAIALESEMIEGSDIEKLAAKNENLLDIEHGSKDVISLKDEIPTMKDKKAKKRKRASMDLIENPQRMKVAKYSEI